MKFIDDVKITLSFVYPRSHQIATIMTLRKDKMLGYETHRAAAAASAAVANTSQW